MKKSILALTILCFFITSVFGTYPVYAQSSNPLDPPRRAIGETGWRDLAGSGSLGGESFRLPAPGQMVALSPAFSPAVLKGIKLDSQNPFRFHFFVDTGDDSLPLVGRAREGELKQEATRLIKYFLASLTIPEKDLWVNLSPYEKDRIVPQEFGQTEMGRDLLAEDYLLKQITASIVYPESQLGKAFWQKVYTKAQAQYGTTNVAINTFNKVWIVPEKAVVYENRGTAFVLENHLKVMLEEDYLALQKHNSPPLVGGVRGGVVADKAPPPSLPHEGGGINALGSQIIREIVIPALTKEVNEGKNFAPLRQVFYSLILATWYKKKIKDSILNKVYSNRSKISNLSSPNAFIGDPQYIYQQYLQAFKKGVFNYIKEDSPTLEGNSTVNSPPLVGGVRGGAVIPRKYFSGGVVGQITPIIQYKNSAQVSSKDFAQMGPIIEVTGDMAMTTGPSHPAGGVMPENEEIERVSVAVRSMEHAQGELLNFEKRLIVIGWFLEHIRNSYPALSNGKQVKEFDKAVEGAWDINVRRNFVRLSKVGQVDIKGARLVGEELKKVLNILRGQRLKWQEVMEQNELLIKQQSEEEQEAFGDILPALDQAIEILESRIEVATGHKPDEKVAMVDIVAGLKNNGVKRGWFRLIIENYLPDTLNIIGNKRSLINALSNIVDNADDFSRKREKESGGVPAKVTMRLMQENNHIKIEISDNGGGVPQALLENDPVTNRLKLFNLNVSQREGGTGLGTTEAWYAIKDMGGAIDVKNEGPGATFTIILPADRAMTEREGFDRLSVGTRSVIHGSKLFGLEKTTGMEAGYDLDILEDIINKAKLPKLPDMKQFFQKQKDLLDLILGLDEDNELRKDEAYLKRIYDSMVSALPMLNEIKRQVVRYKEQNVTAAASISERERYDKYINSAIYFTDYAIESLQSRIDIIEGRSGEGKFAMSEVLDKLQHISGLEKIQFYMDNEVKDALIKGHLISLTSAVYNLIVNAKSAAGPQGNIQATFLFTSDGKIQVIVQDNGPGISDHLLGYETDEDRANGRNRLFNLNVTQTKGGAGLGATEAWRAVRDMGGKIRVENISGDVGKPLGARFTITLPADRAMMTALRNKEREDYQTVINRLEPYLKELSVDIDSRTGERKEMNMLEYLQGIIDGTLLNVVSEGVASAFQHLEHLSNKELVEDKDVQARLATFYGMEGDLNLEKFLSVLSKPLGSGLIHHLRSPAAGEIMMKEWGAEKNLPPDKKMRMEGFLKQYQFNTALVFTVLRRWALPADRAMMTYAQGKEKLKDILKDDPEALRELDTIEGYKALARFASKKAKDYFNTDLGVRLKAVAIQLQEAAQELLPWGRPGLFSEYNRDRETFRPATRLIVEKTLRQYLAHASKILELGSGEGELMGLAPQEMRSRFIQSDVDGDNLVRNQFDTPKLALDVNAIPFEDNSLPGIVSFAALDTFLDLNHAASEMRRVLAKDGVVIGFIDLVPSPEVAMVTRPDEVLFPALSLIPGTKVEYIRSYIRVNKQDLLLKIAEKPDALKLPFFDALLKYIQNPIGQNDIIQNLEVTVQTVMAVKFKKFLDYLGVPYSTVDQVEMFKAQVDAALKQAGFDLIESQIKGEVVDVERTQVQNLPPWDNVIVFNVGARYFGHSPSVPEGKVRVVSSILVIVARKSPKSVSVFSRDHLHQVLSRIAHMQHQVDEQLAVYRLGESHKIGDRAQLSINSNGPGGIDLNPAQMNMQVKKEGNDLEVDSRFRGNDTVIDAAQVTGATFTIRTLTPVTNLPLILGLKG